MVPGADGVDKAPPTALPLTKRNWPTHEHGISNNSTKNNSIGAPLAPRALCPRHPTWHDAPRSILQAGYYSQIMNTGICLGDSVTIGNQVFTQSGVYELLLPGNNACDTLVQLTLQVQDPAAFFTTVPDTVLLTCANPAQTICAVNLPQSSYLWVQNNNPISDQICANISLGGDYQIYASVPGCLAIKNLTALEQQTPPAITLSAQDATGGSSNDGSATIESLTGNGPFTILWSNLVNTTTNNDLVPGDYCATVTDTYGCSTSDCVNVGYLSATHEWATNHLNLYPNPAKPGAYLSLQLPEHLQAGMAQLTWLDQLGRVLAVQSVSTPMEAVQIPAEIPGQFVFVRVQFADRLLVGKLWLVKN